MSSALENDMLTDYGLTEIELAKYKLKKNISRTHNSTWTRKREKLLIELIEAETDILVIANKFSLSVSAIKGKLARLECSYVKRVGPTPLEKAVDEILKRKGIK